MKQSKTDSDLFDEQYWSAVQTLVLLTDTQDLYCELGRGSGKTTHILGPRIDRVQHSMPGAVMVFLASTYKAIFENLVPGIMEFFGEHYRRGMYYEVGAPPPPHFEPCRTLITDWKNTISFANGAVIQFVSCERPERANGKNIAHLFMDEMLHIKQRVVDENVRPAMRSKATLYYNSPYFMGTTGTTSTPNIETDQDWFLQYADRSREQGERIDLIRQLALHHHRLLYRLEQQRATDDNRGARLTAQRAQRLETQLNALRRGTTTYMRASSFANIRVLGLDYIRKQMDSTIDRASFNTSILSIREDRVRDLFFARFGPMYIEDDSYRLERIETLSIDSAADLTCADMLHCDLDMPLYVGYDPGPFTSLVVGQYSRDRMTFRVLKDCYAYLPDQQEQLAYLLDRFFRPMRNKRIFLHYDRAGNQHDPQWKKMERYVGGTGDTDAIMLQRQLRQRGWIVQLMSMGQPTILYRQHLHLLQHLFSGKEDYTVDGRPVVRIRIDAHEAEALISSIYHSPIRRDGGEVKLDKSSEKKPYDQQAYGSTQLASALMYLLWGEFARTYLHASDTHSLSTGFAGFGAVR